MAGGWKKITDKADQGNFEGPFPSDWEAMNAKISAQPDLNTKSGRGGLWRGVGLSLLVLISISAGYWLWQDDSSQPVDQKSKVVVPFQSPEGVDEFDEAVEEGSKEPKATSVTRELPASTVRIRSSGKELKKTEQMDLETGNKESESENQIVVTHGSIDEERMEIDEAVTPGTGLIEPETNLISGSEEITEENDVSVEDSESEKSSEEESQEGISEMVDAEDTRLLDEENILLDEGVVMLEDTLSSPELLDVTDQELEQSAEVSLMEDEEEDETSINLRSAGFRLNSLSLGAKYLTDYSGSNYGLGLGVDVDIQRKGLLINTGVSYYQFNTSHNVNQTWDEVSYDTSWVTQYDTTVSEVKYPVWIVDSAYHGHYDTIRYSTTQIDSLMEENIDTTVTNKVTNVKERVKLSYVEIPILIGHRFRFNRFAFDLYGGVALSQTISSNIEGGEIDQNFGLTAVVQPGLRYYIKPDWSVFARSGLRYGLVVDEFREKKLYSNFHLGITYHW